MKSPDPQFRDAHVLATVDDGRWDLSDAGRFGTVSSVSSLSSLYPDDVDDRLPGIVSTAGLMLSNFDSDRDSIALVGDPLIIAAVIAAAAKTFDRVAVLKFDRQEKAYYRTVIDLTHIGESTRDNQIQDVAHQIGQDEEKRVYNTTQKAADGRRGAP